MDVHPPLAKLLITLAGWLAGFNGDFDFKDIGKDYIEPGVPYVAMRTLPALLGVMLIPVIFLTLKSAGCRTSTAGFGAALLIFGMDISLVVEVYWLIESRERPSYTVALHSPRLPSNDLHRFHRLGFYKFHKST